MEERSEQENLALASETFEKLMENLISITNPIIRVNKAYIEKPNI